VNADDFLVARAAVREVVHVLLSVHPHQRVVPAPVQAGRAAVRANKTSARCGDVNTGRARRLRRGRAAHGPRLRVGHAGLQHLVHRGAV
jgi:hypothetical protein